jgi:hypothetical protein
VTKLARLVLIMSSFLPLFFLLALRASVDDAWVAIAFCFLSVVLIISLFAFLNSLNKKIPAEFNLRTIEPGSQNVAAYMVAYLVPFAGVSFLHWQDVAAVAVFLVLLVGIFYQADFFHFNPVLILFGYKLWDCEVNSATTNEEHWKMVVLVKTSDLTPTPGDITVRKLNRQMGVYVAKTDSSQIGATP